MGNVFLCMGPQCHFSFCYRAILIIGKIMSMNYIPAGTGVGFGKVSSLVSIWGSLQILYRRLW
jgi:hypothetical protein